MSCKKALWAGLLVVALGGLVFGHRPLIQALVSTGQQQSKVVAIGEKVQDFTVTDVEGKAWKLSGLQKRTESGVLSLTFWCTFCHSCRMMDARFQKQAAEFKDKAAVLAIDASAADTAKIVEILGHVDPSSLHRGRGGSDLTPKMESERRSAGLVVGGGRAGCCAGACQAMDAPAIALTPISIGVGVRQDEPSAE